MAAELFVDTSAWYPLLVSSHPDHSRLAAGLRAHVAKAGRVVTSNLVVAETQALVMRRVGQAPALAFTRTVDRAPNIVVRSTEALEAAAIENWLAPYADHDFSFADAVSFAIMKERRIKAALTLDRHFGVAGFTIVGGA